MPKEGYSRFLAEIGENLRTRRESRGLTQAQLAELADVSQRYVAGIEAGRQSPSLRRLYLLARLLEASPADLVKPSQPKKRNPGRPKSRKSSKR